MTRFLTGTKQQFGGDSFVFIDGQTKMTSGTMVHFVAQVNLPEEEVAECSAEYLQHALAELIWQNVQLDEHCKQRPFVYRVEPMGDAEWYRRIHFTRIYKNPIKKPESVLKSIATRFERFWSLIKYVETQSGDEIIGTHQGTCRIQPTDIRIHPWNYPVPVQGSELGESDPITLFENPFANRVAFALLRLYKHTQWHCIREDEMDDFHQSPVFNEWMYDQINLGFVQLENAGYVTPNEETVDSDITYDLRMKLIQHLWRKSLRFPLHLWDVNA